MDSDNIRFFQHFLKRKAFNGKLGSPFFRQERIINRNGHAKGLGALGQLRTNPAHADNAQCLSE
ncbi:Uncharacterised protein [Mycobacteroides abscessus subsp. abscessus]|nr:Uncharacterised protein [Mycobacteroides abscessus subsp. abscessus]